MSEPLALAPVNAPRGLTSVLSLPFFLPGGGPSPVLPAMFQIPSGARGGFLGLIGPSSVDGISTVVNNLFWGLTVTGHVTLMSISFACRSAIVMSFLYFLRWLYLRSRFAPQTPSPKS